VLDLLDKKVHAAVLAYDGAKARTTRTRSLTKPISIPTPAKRIPRSGGTSHLVSPTSDLACDNLQGRRLAADELEALSR